MNDFMLLVGRHFTALPTLADQQGSELQLDSSGRLIISGRYLEDSAHASGDAGLFAMGVRDDGVQATATVGPNTFTAVNYGTSGNLISLIFDGVDDVTTVVAAWNGANPNNQVTFTGSGATVPSAQTVNLTGGAANTVWTSAHGDYSPIAVDKYGRINVVASVSVEPSDAEFMEDSPNTSGDVGIHVLTVRQDTLATSTSANGDYADFKVNALGELYVHDTDANASLNNIESSTSSIDTKLTTTNSTLATIDTSLNNIETSVGSIDTKLTTTNSTLATIDTSLNNIETDIANLTQVEDAVHNSGDTGIMSLAVRNDAGTPLAADGDYIPLTTDSTGALRTTTTLTAVGAEQYSVTDALAAGGDGLATITATATPWVTVASFAHASGTAYVFGYQWACDQNADARLITDDGVDVIVYKRSLNSSSAPTWAEHWANEGRIEIPGGAGLEIKLQIKKRSATGGNGLGSGSIHIRK
jgi:hypothetical protein